MCKTFSTLANGDMAKAVHHLDITLPLVGRCGILIIANIRTLKTLKMCGLIFLEPHDPAVKSCENVLKILSQDFHDIDLPQLPCMSRDDKRALAIMEESLKKVNGHYQVAFPWKNDSPNLSKSLDG